MIKDYYIVDKITNKVTHRATVDEDRVESLYPDSIIVEAGELYISARPAYPGCLYYENSFWSPIQGSGLKSSNIDYKMYRGLFTKEELRLIDCYYMDDSLTTDQKRDSKTLLTTLQHLGYDLRETDTLTDSLDLWLSIGYISQERYNQIKDNLGVS